MPLSQTEKIRICTCISLIDKSLAYEWISERLDSSAFENIFVLLNPGQGALERYLRANNKPCYSIHYGHRRDIPLCIVKMFLLFMRLRPSIVHANHAAAGVICLIAARLLGIRNRIFTRHHSTVFSESNNRMAVLMHNVSSRLATTVFAISDVVRRVLIEEGVPPAKIRVVPHGFALEYFGRPDPTSVERLRIAYNPRKRYPVIGMISRYISMKGLQYAIPAFGKFLQHYPNALLMLANARGDFATEVKTHLSRLPDTSYVEIPFEQDLVSLYHQFTLFMHVPIDPVIEAFGQTYIECLACGIPGIFTLSGIAHDVVRHGENAYVVDYRSSNGIYDALICLMQDARLRERLRIKGIESVAQRYSLATFIKTFEDEYRRCTVENGNGQR